MNRQNINYQITISIALVVVVALVMFALKMAMGYYIPALILMLLVSILAMLFDIVPVLIAAVLSALIWNFFFIPPLFTFHINKPEDLLMFLMYFVIALVNTVLTSKIRQQEQSIRDKEEKEKTIILYNTVLNSLSHELRTPITTIMGAVDTLQENYDHLSIENQKLLLSEVENATQRLNRQVNNLLNMSRLESNLFTIKKDWCEIEEIYSAVLTKLTPAIKNHNLIFDTENKSLPLFKLDIALMEEILYNLIHNALQYTPEHSKIRVSASVENDKLCLKVNDNGGGFPDEQIPLVFNKFYRLPQTKTGGTGLGLSIVKGFVEAHNGTISLENNTEGGATFTIWIPTETTYINQLKNE